MSDINKELDVLLSADKETLKHWAMTYPDKLEKLREVFGVFQIVSKTGMTKSRDSIALYTDERVKSYKVIHYGLCGYDNVEYTLSSAQEAENLFNALLPVVEIEED